MAHDMQAPTLVDTVHRALGHAICLGFAWFWGANPSGNGSLRGAVPTQEQNGYAPRPGPSVQERNGYAKGPGVGFRQRGV